MENTSSILWLRRDLRLYDNHALSVATKTSSITTVVFVFDKIILDKLKHKEDRRLQFIHSSLAEVDQGLRKKGSRLVSLYGDPTIEIPKLAQQLKANKVLCNEDFEPYAKRRDKAVAEKLANQDIAFESYKDQVIFRGDEVLKKDGTPYQVFTPYKNAWLKRLRKEHVEEHGLGKNSFTAVEKLEGLPKLHSLKDLGFQPTEVAISPGQKAGRKSLKNFANSIANYHKARDIPALDGTSHLSVHFRFGTISIREAMRLALSKKSQGHRTWLSELIWREFFQMILDRFPHVEKNAFKSQYDKIKWPGSNEHFKAWCQGQTGYAIVDAGMRQLNATGMMHNRVRMITASFLVKDLLVDWRKGEKYFADHLLDFDLAANNGGWQWCASTGCDAQPYFRIFNPFSQMKKFDPDREYIARWAPEYVEEKGRVPEMIVDHDVQRKKALQLYKAL